MPVTDSYKEYVTEQLSRVQRVTSRRLFGGVGFYAGTFFFAIIDDDVLYFKVDDGNRPDYEAKRMEPFRPFGPGTTPMQYYAVPGEVLDDVDELGGWMAKAIWAARSRKKRR